MKQEQLIETCISLLKDESFLLDTPLYLNSDNEEMVSDVISAKNSIRMIVNDLEELKEEVEELMEKHDKIMENVVEDEDEDEDDEDESDKIETST